MLWTLVYELYTMKRCTQKAEQTQERCIFQAAKLEEQSPLSPLTSDIVPEDVVLALGGFSFALAQYFLKILSFLSLGIVIYNLYHFMLEVWDCLLILKGRQQDFLVSQKRVLTLKQYGY